MTVHVYHDRVWDKTSTTGTGTLTLEDTPPDGFRSPDTVYTQFHTGAGNFAALWCCKDSTNWEIFEGTYTGSTLALTRGTIIASSNNNARVDFGVGAKDVFIVSPSQHHWALAIKAGEIIPSEISNVNAGLFALGTNNYVNGTNAFSIGDAVSSSGNPSFGLGRNVVVSGDSSMVFGLLSTQGGTIDNHRAIGFLPGYNINNGDTGLLTIFVYETTSDASTRQMGGTLGIIPKVPNVNCLMLMDIIIMGAQLNTTNCFVKVWRDIIVHKDAAITTKSTPSPTVLHDDSSSTWTAVLNSIASNRDIDVDVTGAAATNIYWTMIVKIRFGGIS